MREKFSDYECGLITKCWDENDKYTVNINPETNKVAIIDRTNNKVIWNLGYDFEVLFRKMLELSEIEETNFIL